VSAGWSRPTLDAALKPPSTTHVLTGTPPVGYGWSVEQAECAAASGSVLIVSDDDDLIRMSPWRGTPVVTAEEFVKRTDAMRRAHHRRSG
jgi:hypothetical protein